MFWCIDRIFKMTYTKLSDRSVETCEAYRRGRACGSLPLLFLRRNDMQTPKKISSFSDQVSWISDESSTWMQHQMEQFLSVLTKYKK